MVHLLFCRGEVHRVAGRGGIQDRGQRGLFITGLYINLKKGEESSLIAGPFCGPLHVQWVLVTPTVRGPGVGQGGPTTLDCPRGPGLPV